MPSLQRSLLGSVVSRGSGIAPQPIMLAASLFPISEEWLANARLLVPPPDKSRNGWEIITSPIWNSVVRRRVVVTFWD